jgi:regulatory protein
MTHSKAYQECLDAMIYFCNYRERCKSELVKKLQDFDLDQSEKESIISTLEELNIVDEKRYLEFFIRGKFRLKKWGKNKIKVHLISKGIDQKSITAALDEWIDEEEYIQVIEQLFLRKWDQLKNKKDYATKQKVYRYLYSKGFESDSITACFRKFFVN